MRAGAALAGFFLALPAPAVASAPLIGLSLGGEPALSVSVGGESGVSASVGGGVGIDVGGEKGVGVTLGGEGGAAGVSVGGQPVVTVPAPTVPVSPPAPPAVEGVSPPPVSTGSPPAPKPPSAPGSSSTAAAAASANRTTANRSLATPSVAHAVPSARSRPASRRHGAARLKSRARPGATSSGASSAGAVRDTAAARRVARSKRSSSANDPLDAIGSDIPLPLPVPDWSKPIILALLIACLALALRTALTTRRARRLERQRHLLMRDVDAMQAALVPAIPPEVGGLLVSVAYRPADGPAAGGDFYDVFTPAAGEVAVILGDVSGHGREALTRAALTRYTLRAYMQAGMRPRAALALAGKVLAEPDCELLATVAVGLYDVEHGTFTYALAGHPPPIATGCDLPDPPIVCCSPPLGWDIPTGRRQCTISVPPGGAVCLFSDGLIEARCTGGDGRDLLGRERLGALFASLGEERPATDLLEAVRSAAAATPDDMAACVLRPNPAQDTALCRLGIHREELEVDRRAIASGHVREFLAACSLEPSEVDRLLDRADATAEAFRTALLTVDRSAAGPAAEVAAPPPPGALDRPPEQATRRTASQALLGSSAI